MEPGAETASIADNDSNKDKPRMSIAEIVVLKKR